jgi:ABC-type phosphate transport system auxiliary subunit
MTENTTKVVSARLPLVDYLQITQAAGEKKMTVADFVLLKLFAPADPSAKPLQEATNQLKELTTQVTALETNKTKLIGTIHSWKKHSDTLQQTQQSTATELQQAIQQVEQLRQQLAKQEKQTTILTQQLQTVQTQHVAAQKRFQDLRQALTQENEGAFNRFGQLGDRYWAIVNHFIPEKP